MTSHSSHNVMGLVLLSLILTASITALPVTKTRASRQMDPGAGNTDPNTQDPRAPIKMDIDPRAPIKMDNNQTMDPRPDLDPRVPIKMDANQTMDTRPLVKRAPIKMTLDTLSGPIKMDLQPGQPIKMDSNQTMGAQLDKRAPIKMSLDSLDDPIKMRLGFGATEQPEANTDTHTQMQQ